MLLQCAVLRIMLLSEAAQSISTHQYKLISISPHLRGLLRPLVSVQCGPLYVLRLAAFGRVLGLGIVGQRLPQSAASRVDDGRRQGEEVLLRPRAVQHRTQR